MARYDVVVVGGGILGLATAYRVLGRRPGSRVAVIEKETELARHQSGRNSGVLHAGIYYAPGSLKARLAVRGKREIEAFANEHDLPVDRCGKLVIARDESELPTLREVGRRAAASGVEGIREVDGRDIARIEPNARGVAALHSPGTAVTDFARITHALADEVWRRGGSVRIGEEVVGLEERDGQVRVTTTQDQLEADRGVACAGLQSDRGV
ncbi:MAG: FAD-dependent oxidoreductase, partial [Nitriliruptorales bacterium]